MAEVVPIIEQTHLLNLLKALEGIPAKIEQKIMRSAMRKAMSLIADAVRTSYPTRSGKLRDSVRLRGRKRGKQITVQVTVGERLKRLSKPGEEKPDLAWYAHIVEFGAAPHIIRAKDKGKALQLAPNLYLKEVSHPGFTGRGYLRRAFDRNAQKAIDTFGKEFERLLERELRQTAAASRRI